MSLHNLGAGQAVVNVLLKAESRKQKINTCD